MGGNGVVVCLVFVLVFFLLILLFPVHCGALYISDCSCTFKNVHSYNYIEDIIVL